MSEDQWIDEIYCGACGCHFDEDEIAQNALLQDVCPHCGCTDIYLVDHDDDDDCITQPPNPPAQPLQNRT